MALNVDLDMRVDPESEVSMSVEDGDEVSFGVAEAIVVKDHATLDNRDLPDQHPISAITGLAEALAESGKIDTVKVNGTALPVVNKAVDVPVPTTTSQLTNNSGFITESDIPVTSVNGMTGDVVVSGLPSATEDGTALVYVNGEWTNQTGYGYRTLEMGEVMSETFSSTAFSPVILSSAFEPILGKTYSIEFDNNTYANLTPFTGTVQGYGDVIALGNGQMFGLQGGDPNCPFIYGYISSLQVGGAVASTDGDHSIVINGKKYIVHSFSSDFVVGENMNGKPQGDSGWVGEIGSIRFQQGISAGLYSTAFSTAKAFGKYSFAVGYNTTASGDNCFAEGKNTSASGIDSHAEGYGTIANGSNAHAEGNQTTASGYYSHAEGNSAWAEGYGSHAEGVSTIAEGTCSHAEGSTTYAEGDYSHAEGGNTHAKGDYSHAEGYATHANWESCHAEGARTTASGSDSHAEGNETTASGLYSHSEGAHTVARGICGHAEGFTTIANRGYQHVFGMYNIEETGDSTTKGTYVEIVGNGTGINTHSNARTLDWSGNEVLAGTLTVGADPTNNMEVATKQYVDGAIPTVPVTSVNGRTGAVIGLAEASSLATVATTGSYNDLTDKPTIPTVPTNVSAFTNDAGYLVASDLVEATDADVIAIVV